MFSVLNHYYLNDALIYLTSFYAHNNYKFHVYHTDLNEGDVNKLKKVSSEITVEHINDCKLFEDYHYNSSEEYLKSIINTDDYQKCMNSLMANVFVVYDSLRGKYPNSLIVKQDLDCMCFSSLNMEQINFTDDCEVAMVNDESQFCGALYNCNFNTRYNAGFVVFLPSFTNSLEKFVSFMKCNKNCDYFDQDFLASLEVFTLPTELNVTKLTSVPYSIKQYHFIANTQNDIIYDIKNNIPLSLVKVVACVAYYELFKTANNLDICYNVDRSILDIGMRFSDNPLIMSVFDGIY